MGDSEGCPLCGNKAAKIGKERCCDRVECKRCGTYALGAVGRRAVEGDLMDRRPRISAITRESQLRGKKLLLLSGEAWVQLDGFEAIQIEEVVGSRFPRSLDERLERALLNLACMSTHFGERLAVMHDDDYPLVFAMNVDESRFILDTLSEAGYIGDGSDSRAGLQGFCVSPAGWNRIAELRAGRVGERLDQAFVAMWFGDPQDKIDGKNAREFLDDAFKNGFEVGITNAGYAPLRIDLKEFNDSISDHIIAEIRRSKFIVADFTGQRGGVYFEAGFAQGLGQQVVFTCHESDIGKVHFDTNHFKHIVWKTPQDLAKQLELRIRATLGEGPLVPPQAMTSGRT